MDDLVEGKDCTSPVSHCLSIDDGDFEDLGPADDPKNIKDIGVGGSPPPAEKPKAPTLGKSPAPAPVPNPKPAVLAPIKVESKPPPAVQQQPQAQSQFHPPAPAPQPLPEKKEAKALEPILPVKHINDVISSNKPEPEPKEEQKRPSESPPQPQAEEAPAVPQQEMSADKSYPIRDKMVERSSRR